MTWQDPIVWLVVALCSWYIWRSVRAAMTGKKSGCGCGKPCTAVVRDKSPGLVQIDISSHVR